jgi:hypothetical protein
MENDLNMTKKYNLNLILEQSARDGIDNFKSEVGIDSDAEILKDALSYYSNLVDIFKDGYRLGLIYGDGKIIEVEFTDTNSPLARYSKGLK